MPAKSTKSPKGPKSQKCAKCGGAMGEGNVLDRGPYSVATRAQWAKGGAQFSLREGLTTSYGNRTVATWRCTGCGYLESYAN